MNEAEEIKTSTEPVPGLTSGETERIEKDREAYHKKSKVKSIMISLAVVGIACLIISFATVVFVIAAGVRTFEMQGKSMEPAFADGEIVVLRNGTAERRDVVVYPANSSNQVGRIVAVAGDQVSFREDGLYINGEKEALDEETGRVTTKPLDSLLNNEFTVPAGKLMILDDNRETSADSRIQGLIEERAVFGEYWFTLQKPQSN